MRILMTMAVLLMAAAPALAGEIHTAAAAGDATRVAELLAADPSLLTATAANTTLDLPLHSAAAAGQTEVVALLLDRGADIEAHDADRSTPLHVAALFGHPETVDLLLARGADVAFQDDNGAWSLSFAASGNQVEICRTLVAAGAPLDLHTASGLSLLDYAAINGLDELFEQTLAAGVPVDEVRENGRTVLHNAARGGDPEMIRRLVDAGLDPNAADAEGGTPLMNAAWGNQAEGVSALIAAGADPAVTDNWHRSVLWIAAARGNADMARTVLEAGVDPDCGDAYNFTPLLAAVRNGHTEVATALLAGGANPDLAETHTGRTPLHLAAMNGYGDLVQALVDGQATVWRRDAAEHTPLDLADRYGHKPLAAALVAAGAERDEDASPCPSETGCLVVCEDKGKPETADLEAGAARLWYLGHSGYAVQTRNHLLIFDYFTGDRAADDPALCNGFIDPAEIADRKVTVFASHAHRDHLDPTIFTWADQVPDIRYVVGCRAETDQAYEMVEPRQAYDFDGVAVRTIESNDSGVGFLVEADGLVIYHAGDHANRQRDFSGPYCGEIDWLAAHGKRPDIAMMPISGCGFGDQEAVRLGVNYALEKLQPQVFVPLHALNSEYRYRDFVGKCRNDFPTVRMITPSHRGDHYDYRQGTIG